MRFEVGDVVVYASHGIGRVAARGKRDVLGAKPDLVVLEFASGLKVTLPLERARGLLRPLAGEAEVVRVKATLREEAPPKEEPWLKRRNDLQAKLAAGGAIELAEIVRDGAIRERSLAARGQGTKSSDAEREILGRARHLLVGEIAMALGLDLSQADAWIEQQLTYSVG
jgi:CarD family transcriptional regulator